MIADDFNCARYRPGTAEGHYESYFQRANHPTRPLAFWIRYTVFSPAGRPHDAVGELWAILFDGENDRHLVAKSETPIRDCALGADRFAARIGDSELGPGILRGRAETPATSIAWDLTYRGDAPPVFDLPLDRYDAGFPKAKALVGLPMARFAGVLEFNGRQLAIEDWVGSQNHNWGSRHTDRYAWGQVCGFDNAPDSFLEVVSARPKIGPFWPPLMTFLVLRHNGAEYALNSLWRAFRAKASYNYFSWRFATENELVRVEGEMRAARDAFVGLEYRNPPGGAKVCLNSKIAGCAVRVTNLATGRTERLQSETKAAFEILTDEADHGVDIRA